MIAKICFTLAIIFIVFVFVRFRQQRLEQLRDITPAELATRKTFKIIGWMILVLMAIVLSLILWEQWKSRTTSITIQVVNTQNDKITTYQAFKRDINMRDFTTKSGRHIILAPVERMELIRSE